MVGDDLLVTNPKRIQKGLDENLCNALLLKVNQIGSVTESIEASNMSQAAGWGVMVSHRSGETTSEGFQYNSHVLLRCALLAGE